MVSVDPTLHLKEPGDTSTYYLVVRNDTKGVITNLEIREHLPADLEFVSSKPQPIKQDSHNIVWQALKLGTSSADDYFVPTVTVRLLRSLKPGESLTSEQTVTYVDAQGNQRINRSVVIPVKVRAKRGEDLER
jgi:uncharacterized repeat protein (TIGR01451 family)